MGDGTQGGPTAALRARSTPIRWDPDRSGASPRVWYGKCRYCKNQVIARYERTGEPEPEGWAYQILMGPAWTRSADGILRPTLPRGETAGAPRYGRRGRSFHKDPAEVHSTPEGAPYEPVVMKYGGAREEAENGRRWQSVHLIAAPDDLAACHCKAIVRFEPLPQT
ncbi:MAG TPA: hypothetical protein VND24_04690 [Steroidobacteraceae bacterium]|nr:hypothetical protein [Steroidobacteraceae bacterium]